MSRQHLIKPPLPPDKQQEFEPETGTKKQKCLTPQTFNLFFVAKYFFLIIYIIAISCGNDNFSIGIIYLHENNGASFLRERRHLLCLR